MSPASHRRKDREEIVECIMRYARGLDRCDWALVRSTYHPDAHDDHGAYKGGVDGFINWLQRRHRTINKSMHFITNCIVEFDSEDGAVAESYFIARQTMGPDATESRRMLLGEDQSVPDDASVNVEILGRYIDRFEKRDAAWRIARRTVLFELLNAEVDRSVALTADWTPSLRDDGDALAVLRREVELPELMHPPAG